MARRAEEALVWWLLLSSEVGGVSAAESDKKVGSHIPGERRFDLVSVGSGCSHLGKQGTMAEWQSQ